MLYNGDWLRKLSDLKCVSSSHTFMTHRHTHWLLVGHNVIIDLVASELKPFKIIALQSVSMLTLTNSK